MIKILYLMNHAGKAGTETYVRSLAEKLHNKQIKAYFAYNEEGLLVEWLKSLGVETIKLPMKHRLDVKAARELSKICKRLDIDIIHTQYQRENYIALMSRFFNPKVKVMYTSHFIIQEALPWRILNRFLIPLEANIVAVCNPGKNRLISNGYKKDRISVIHNGVIPEEGGEQKQSTMREDLGIAEDVFILFCASRFDYDKGHEFLINSIAELKKICSRKFKLVLAGTGPFYEQRVKQVKDMELEDDILFIGFSKNIKNLYRGSDLYVNSSQHEALSFAIIEALSEGLPVVATDMGGNSDIINDETKCGILVRYNDPVGMAQAINKVMNDEALRVQLAENALIAVRNRFNLNKMVSDTYGLYLKSCGQTQEATAPGNV